MRINMYLFLILILAISCSSQTVHKYDIVELTASMHQIVKTNVSQNMLKHSFYKDTKYLNGKIVSIEYREQSRYQHQQR